MRTPLGAVAAFAKDPNVPVPSVTLADSHGCRLFRAGKTPSTRAVALVGHTVMVWCTQTGAAVDRVDLKTVATTCAAAALPVLAVDVWCGDVVAIATADGVIVVDVAGGQAGCVRFLDAPGCRSARFGMACTPAHAVLYVAAADGVGVARVRPATGLWADDYLRVARLAQPAGRTTGDGIGAWPANVADGVHFRAAGTDVVVAAAVTDRGLAIAATIGTGPTRHYVVRGHFVALAVAAAVDPGGARATVLSLTQAGRLAVHTGPDWRPRAAVAADPTSPVWLDHCWPSAARSVACAALGPDVVEVESTPVCSPSSC